MPELVAERRSYPNRWLADTHDFHQLLIGLDGAVEVEVSGLGGRVTALAGCVIPAGHTHHYYAADANNQHLVLDLPLSLLPALPAPDVLQRVFDAPRFLPLDGPLQSLLRTVARELEAASPLKRYGLGLTLLAALDERLSRTPPRPSRLDLAALERWIDQHLAQPLSVDQLAARCHLSRSQFTRLFKAATGQSPYDYLLSRRLSKACDLLSATPLPISEIALGTGFASASAFSAAFAKRYGLSPRAWRQQQLASMA